MIKTSRQNPTGFPWVEGLLAFVVAVLILQIFPEIGEVLLWTIDLRNWPRTAWFVINLLVLSVLLAVRFAPQIVEDWRSRRERLSVEQIKRQQQLELNEQRDSLERMKQALRRRIY
jgi:cytochrome c biogenesis protein ResB